MSEERKSVRPLNRKNLLKSEDRPGYTRVWVLDNRVGDYEEGGFTTVNRKTANHSRKDLGRGEELGASVVSVNAGMGDKLVLMEITDEEYAHVREERVRLAEEAVQGIYAYADEAGLSLGSNRGRPRGSFNSD